ncbi:hypothetical protein N234_16215 [Ralstonia pickettii DTP0602]|nr:hypothetical protein N234_16215 [Ralstonia pickettii DTP0602]
MKRSTPRADAYNQLLRFAHRRNIMRTDQSYTGSSDVLVLAVSLELAAAKWKVALRACRRAAHVISTA